MILRTVKGCLCFPCAASRAACSAGCFLLAHIRSLQAAVLSRRGKDGYMGEMTVVRYGGQDISVTMDVAEFLAENGRELLNSDRRYRRHNVPLKYMDPDLTLDAEHCTGRYYLLGVVIRNLENEYVRSVVRSLGEEQYQLFVMRYEKNMTQQQIADRLGLSKMAICKRLKKLHGDVRRILKTDDPDWSGLTPAPVFYAFIQICKCTFIYRFTNPFPRDLLVEG